MEILSSIGLDGTIVYHLALFLITFLVLNGLVFKPYFKAFSERAHRTEGSQDLAQEALRETEELRAQYEKKAQEMNRVHKNIYDKARVQAQGEYDKIVEEGRHRAGVVLQQNREKISSEIESARAGLADEIPAVSRTIASKLLGKELH